MTVVGNLGKDAEIKTYNDKSYLVFSVASTKKKGNEEKTTWVSCTWWTKVDNIAQYLKKGQMVAVVGEGELRQYESNGTKGTSLDLNVDNLKLCGTPSSQQPSQAAAPAQAYQQPAASPQPQYAQPVAQAPVTPQPQWNGTAWMVVQNGQWVPSAPPAAPVQPAPQYASNPGAVPQPQSFYQQPVQPTAVDPFASGPGGLPF